MIYINISESKTKDDYINLLSEISSYKILDGKNFDFGTGIIINDMSFGSEDAYYEMCIQELEGIIDNWDCNKKNIKKAKKRPNRHARKRKQIEKLKKLRTESGYYPVYSNYYCYYAYPKRWYRGKRSAYLKKQSNKKIRNYKGSFEPKSNKFHRVFDFWWELE